MSAWRVTRISKYIGGWEENKLWKHSGCWQHSWIMMEPGLRAERTHKSQHPVQAGLSYQEKRDMIILNTHFLPVYEREKRRCHHHAGCLSNFRLPDKFSKHTKLSQSIRYGSLSACQRLSCRFPFPPYRDPGDPGISWLPWPPVLPPAALSQ